MDFEKPTDSQESAEPVADEAERTAEAAEAVAEKEAIRARFFEAAKGRIEQLVGAGEISEEYGQAFLENTVGPIETRIGDDPEVEGLAFVENIVGHRIGIKKQIKEKIEREIVPAAQRIEELSEAVSKILEEELTESTREKIEAFKAQLEAAKEKINLTREGLETIIENLFTPPRTIEDEMMSRIKG